MAEERRKSVGVERKTAGVDIRFIHSSFCIGRPVR